MNKCIFGAARLTRDPEITTSQSGVQIARFGIAVNRDYKVAEGQPTADFINCTAFQHKADFAEKYLKKGTKVNIESHVQTGSYTNRDGEKVHTTDFIIDRIEFCESKSTSNNTENNSQPAQQNNNDFVNIPDNIPEELPFN